MVAGGLDYESSESLKDNPTLFRYTPPLTTAPFDLFEVVDRDGNLRLKYEKFLETTRSRHTCIRIGRPKRL